MKLKYQTGIVAFIQFITGSTLGFANGAVSSISGCTNHGTDCVSNTIVTLILIILTVVWFGFVAILGYAAQDRRSRRLARLLILAEIAIGLIALFDAMHYTNLLSLITSLVDFVLALWIMLLAYRLSKSGGGRIVTSGSNRKRKRRHTV
jgi:energy-converting hydrogenase Eha subunit C